MWSNYGRELLNITAETNAQEAMMNCHEKSILPSLDQLYHCHDSFYKMAQHEFAFTQYTLERQAAQLQTLERARSNKTNKTSLYWTSRGFSTRSPWITTRHYLQLAKLPRESIAALHNHMVTSHSLVARVEFTTEAQDNTFRETTRQGCRYWRGTDSQDCKIRMESEIPIETGLQRSPTVRYRMCWPDWYQHRAARRTPAYSRRVVEADPSDLDTSGRDS